MNAMVAIATVLSCSIMLGLGACCTKEDCLLPYTATQFRGFTIAEVDTVLVATQDIASGAVSDTTLYRTTPDADSTNASLDLGGSVVINRNLRYTYFLPGIGHSYVLDGYEFGMESCNRCTPRSAEKKDNEILVAYRLNGVRYEGRYVVIQK